MLHIFNDIDSMIEGSIICINTYTCTRTQLHAHDRTPGTPRNPRPVIVKFTSYEPRRAIFTAKRKLKGTKFVITENLTRRRMELLRKARASAKVEASWTSDGRIVCLLSTGRKVTVTNESHLKGLI